MFQNKCWNIAVVQVNNALDVGREEAFAGLTVKISKNLTCRNEIQRSGSFSKVYFNATYYQNVSTQYLLQINNYAGRYRCFGNSFLASSIFYETSSILQNIVHFIKDKFMTTFVLV